jgi:hypothetical protein
MFPVKTFPLEQTNITKEPEKISLTPWYITGFCEGESAFTFSRQGKGLELYFAIKSNSDDRELIERIRDFFGVGHIYNVKARPPKARSGNTREAVYYRVSKISHLESVVRHFDKYPLIGKKKHAYKIWKKMFLLKKDFRKPDFVRLQQLAIALSKLSSKNTATRRTLP